MFRVRSNLRSYLEVVRAWAMGKDNRGWVRDDFQTLPPFAGGFNQPEFIDREDVKAARTDLGHIIFPIVPYDINVLDRLFHTEQVLFALQIWNQKVAAFNAVLVALNASEDKETRWQRIILLHAGTIGTTDGPGIYAAFRNLEEVLR